MTASVPSLVLIVPATLKRNVDAALDALGWGPGNLVVPLSRTGAAPATHWGCRATPDAAVTAWLAARPPALAALIADQADVSDTGAHWAAVLAAHGLIRVHEE